ncbi:Gfo/Idh/MocA family oxidoreductase [Pseudomonas alcaligenes]|uniref:Gfo/Idh/MocA family protein n=1 Tax=Pseudomonas sp. RIT-PI-AD TaxID=3035294 RepID=UPI0021D88AFA
MSNPDTQGKVRYAVVGGGWISQAAFMPGVVQTRNSVMTALVTGDPRKAKELAARYGLKSYAYEDYEQLLGSGEIDAVYVATPNFLHRQFVLPALKAGIHVLLEKPAETSEAAAWEIVEAARASRAKLMVAYRLHHEPGMLEIIERVHAGEFGEPRLFTSTFTQHVEARNHRAQNGFWAGPAADMGPYPINAVRNLFAAEPIEVHAVGVRTPGEPFNFHDTLTVTLRFPEERLATFTLSYAVPGTERFQLIGREGEVEASPCYGFGPGTAISYRTTLGERQEERKHPVVDQFAGETDYFSSCILEGRDPEADAEEGWLDVRVIAAIQRALESGQPQHLEPYTRSKRPTRAEQVRHYPQGEVPPFVDADSPVAE